MPFDANLVLCDGSAAWSHVNLVTSNTYGTPTSTTRNDGGFAVIDLGSAKIGAAVRGLAVVLILPAADDDADILTAIVEESTTEAFTVPHELAKFDILAAVKGEILGIECPCTVIRRVSPTLRYLRLKAVTTNVLDDFNLGQCLISPYPYKVL